MKASFNKATKKTWYEQSYKLDVWHEDLQAQLKNWAEALKLSNIAANLSSDSRHGQMQHELESIRTDMAEGF